MPRSRLALAVTVCIGWFAMTAGALALEPAEHRLPGATALTLPEGIDVDERTGSFFTASTADGTIYRGSLGAKEAEIWLPGGSSGRLMGQGVEIDDERRLLLVATALQGSLDVYDLDDKRFLGRHQTPAGGYINDVAVTPGGDVYFTDSLRPVLYRVPAADVASDALPEALDIPQDGPFSYSITSDPPSLEPNAAFNAGGIDALDDNTLIVSQINEGRLFRISPDPLTVTEIPVEGAIDNVDGLELRGDRRILVTDNLAEELLTVDLSPAAASARVIRRTSEENFCTPTAVGLVEGRRGVVVVNSQLFRPTGAPVTVSQLPLPLTDSVAGNPDRGRTLTVCDRDLDDAGFTVPSPPRSDAPLRRPAGLQLTRARLDGRRLVLRGRAARVARGAAVRIRFRAVRFGARVGRRSGRLRIARRLPARAARPGAHVVVRYAGSATVLPARVSRRVKR